jgi:hypothetical protein
MRCFCYRRVTNRDRGYRVEPLADRWTPTAIPLQTDQVAQMELQQSVGREDDANLTWAQWQHAVLALLHADVSGVLQSIEIDEVDWEAWRSFYTEGRCPRSAIDRALARDL